MTIFPSIFTVQFYIEAHLLIRLVRLYIYRKLLRGTEILPLGLESNYSNLSLPNNYYALVWNLFLHWFCIYYTCIIHTILHPKYSDAYEIIYGFLEDYRASEIASIFGKCLNKRKWYFLSSFPSIPKHENECIPFSHLLD